MKKIQGYNFSKSTILARKFKTENANFFQLKTLIIDTKNLGSKIQIFEN